MDRDYIFEVLNYQNLSSLSSIARASFVRAVCDQYKTPNQIERLLQVQALTALYQTNRKSKAREKQLFKQANKTFRDLQYSLPLRAARSWWGNWKEEYRVNFLNKALKVEAKQYGFKPTTVKAQFIVDPPDLRAWFDPDNYEVVMNGKELKAVSFRDSLKSLFHEGLHMDQFAEHFEPETEDNAMIRVQYHPGAYISWTDNNRGYRLNPVEVEARSVADEFERIYDSSVSWIT